MGRLKLVKPSPEHKKLIMDYKREFIKNEDSMDGTAGLKDADTYEDWYSSVLDNQCEDTVKDGLVPASTFMAISIENGCLVGMIDIRHRLNDYLLKFGGHIGYSVRKSERQLGYATEMLRLALNECSKLKIEKVLITCDKNNIASAKTVIKNDGKLENEVTQGNKITQRYWISVD